MGVGDYIRQLVHQGVVAPAAACIRQLTGDKRAIGGCQAQVSAQIGDKGIHFLRPVRLSGVAFALVEDKAFDHADFLRLFGKVNNPGIAAAVAAVGSSADAAVRGSTVAAAILHEIFDFRAAISCANQTDFNGCGGVLCDVITECIPRTQAAPVARASN